MISRIETGLKPGVYPALWIPLSKSGNFEQARCLEHVKFLKSSGIDGFMLMGTTAEFARFDVHQRRQMAEFLVEAVAPFPVMLNISHAGFHLALDLAKQAKQLGVAAISALPPYYFKSSQADLAEFLVQIAEQSEMPLVLYNFPELAGTRINPETIRAVCSRTNVIGLKQSGNEFDYHAELARLAAEYKFSLFTGFDLNLTEVLAMGGSGCVSGLANAVPEFLVQTFRDPKNPLPAAKLKTFFELLAPLEFPLNIAAGMEARGFDPGAPKNPLAAETIQCYRHVVDRVREWFKSQGLI